MINDMYDVGSYHLKIVIVGHTINFLWLDHDDD